jgi:hypothetical protein
MKNRGLAPYENRYATLSRIADGSDVTVLFISHHGKPETHETVLVACE